jgi:ribosomal protein S18 acetylase RimI-like enzyme
MTLAFQIREAALSEVESLCSFAWRVFAETFLEDLGCDYPDADIATFREEAYQPDLFARWSQSRDYGVWVAETDGRYIGYAVVSPCSFEHDLARPEHGELKRLYVSRDGQGRGVAPALLGCALDGLKARGRTPVFLSVWSGNHRAQAFYAKHGFEKVGEFKFPVGETLDDEFLMRLA